MNIDTTSLRCFIAAAEDESFTKAADRVGRTQSAVSQQIQKLENMLDTALFERGKQLKLTAEGEIFLQYARKIYALHNEALDRFKQPELEGEVRFGLPEDFASLLLSDVLNDFSRTHPRILLNVECDLTLNLFERFKQNEFDLVLVKMNRPEDFPYGQKVWSEPLEWVGNKNLVDETDTIPLVLSPNPCVYRAAAIHGLEAVGRKWRLIFSSTSYAGMTAAVKAGMGVTVLPHNMVPNHLSVIKSKKLPKLKNIHVSLLKKTKENPAINSFEAFVLKKLNQVT